ncbi:MAG: tryptophan 7-halogenase [Bacteroidota bacterium]
MNKDLDFDVLVLGGGPAGTCAALRLLDMGRKVALVEREVFPRTQIGESLSPGTWNVFNYLKAGHLLKDDGYFPGLQASVIWESQFVQTITPEQRGPGLMVDRGQLDMDLINLAVSRRLYLLQPAEIKTCRKTEERWQIQVVIDGKIITISAKLILDARGRKGVPIKNKIVTAPESIAVWTQVNAGAFQNQTLIEALDNGWLWGAPVSAKQFRVMAFADTLSVKIKRPYDLLCGFVKDSQLFKSVATSLSAKHIQTCKVDHYCHNTPWEDNYIRLGETAFTLDPLSSTGVEKAMRVSLQAAIAVNTVLSGGEPEMARSFYENILIEAISTHVKWTAGYYKLAWPAKELSFWKSRSAESIILSANTTSLQARLKAHLEVSPRNVRAKPAARTEAIQTLESLWYRQVKVSPELTFIKRPCIVDDRLELKMAVDHPCLEREIAYLDQVELAPLLNKITAGDTFGDLMYKWGTALPLAQGARIFVQLYRLGMLLC